MTYTSKENLDKLLVAATKAMVEEAGEDNTLKEITKELITSLKRIASYHDPSRFVEFAPALNPATDLK